MTTQASASNERTSWRGSSALMFSGLISGVWGRCSSAHCPMGVGVSLEPLPALRSGWVMMAVMVWSLARRWRVGSPKAPEPRKTIFMAFVLSQAQRFAAFSICLMRIRFLSLDIWVILSRMRMPSRWSISCCQHLARSPEAVSEISLPSRSVAVMVTMDGRLTSPVIPGSERQPSS